MDIYKKVESFVECKAGTVTLLSATFVPFTSKYIELQVAAPGVFFETRGTDPKGGNPILATMGVIIRSGGAAFVQLLPASLKSKKERVVTIASYGFKVLNREDGSGKHIFTPGTNDMGVKYKVELDQASPFFRVAGEVLDNEEGREFQEWCATEEAFRMGEANKGLTGDEGLAKILGVTANHFANMRRAIPLAGGIGTPGIDAYRMAAESRANGESFGSDEVFADSPLNFG